MLSDIEQEQLDSALAFINEEDYPMKIVPFGAVYRYYCTGFTAPEEDSSARDYSFQEVLELAIELGWKP
jgi:hypothetical protein